MAKLNGKLLKIFELSVKKYGIAELAKKTLTDVIARFSVNDPSGTNKYVQLMIDIMMNESKREIEIIDLIKKFHSVEHKISSKIFPDGAAYKNKKISENPKDIQNYETFKDLLTVYTLANNYVTKKESSNKIVDEETDVIYDGEDYIIVSPLTFQSSCYWGVDTKWCTTTKNEPRYFDDYTKNGTLLYVIDKYRQNDRLHPMSKFALHIRHGNERDGAEIFNRPDNPMGRGMEKVLPDFIIKKLMEYHRAGTLVNYKDVIAEFLKFKEALRHLDLGDDWEQIQDSKVANSMCFKCGNFPSYSCYIKFDYDNNQRDGQMLIKWVEDSQKKLVVTNPGKVVNKQSIISNFRRKTTHSLWNTTINEIIKDDERVYISTKKKILEDIIVNYFKDSLDLEWQFKLLKRELSQNGKVFVMGGTPSSITDLGLYSFQVKGNFADLNIYSATAFINFSSNEFVLLAGETDEISWNKQTKDFNLLYYHEIGMRQLLFDFHNWVIDSLTTKSERIINDLYGDNALKIISKSDAFDEYLKNSDEVSKVIKPTKKGKQFFRHDEMKKLRNVKKYEDVEFLFDDLDSIEDKPVLRYNTPSTPSIQLLDIDWENLPF